MVDEAVEPQVDDIWRLRAAHGHYVRVQACRDRVHIYACVPNASGDWVRSDAEVTSMSREDFVAAFHLHERADGSRSQFDGYAVPPPAEESPAVGPDSIDRMLEDAELLLASARARESFVDSLALQIDMARALAALASARMAQEHLVLARETHRRMAR